MFSFDKIFNENAKIKIDPTKKQIVLQEEKNPNNRKFLSEVYIKNNSGSFIAAYALDKYFPFCKFFNIKNKDGINKGIDAFIVVYLNQKYYLLFIELKSIKINKNEVAQKMFASIAFIKNVQYMLDFFYSQDIKEFKAGAIVISLKKSIRLSKPKPRVDEIKFNNTFYKLNNKKIQILEITKNNPYKFTIKIEDIISNLRGKFFKNW